MKYGCLPYIMRFEKYKESKYKGMYTELARWCNQPNFFKKKSFRQFCEANRDYNKNEMCASYQAMLLFERDRPDIAEKYFDMRFDQLNECISSYGRKITRPCDVCTSSGNYISWDDYFNDRIDNLTFIRYYYGHDIDFSCLLIKPCHSCMANVPIAHLALKVLNNISEMSPEILLRIIDDLPDTDLSAEDIPQISKLSYAIDGLCHLSQQGLSYTEFGSKIDGRKVDTDLGKQKYGENHAKILALIDLAWISKKEKPYTVKISPIGQCLKDYSFEYLVPKLILRIPIIQSILKKAKYHPVDIKNDLTMLKTSTNIRRTSSIRALLRELRGIKSEEIGRRLDNIVPGLNDNS